MPPSTEPATSLPDEKVVCLVDFTGICDIAGALSDTCRSANIRLLILPGPCSRPVVADAALAESITSQRPDAVVILDNSLAFTPAEGTSGLRLAELLTMDKGLDAPILLLTWLSDEALSALAPDHPVVYSIQRSGIGSCNAASLHAERLPLSIEKIRDSISRLLVLSGPHFSADLARTLLENEMERLCRGIRHRHRNVLSSLRLLLGAFAAGHIEQSVLVSSLGDMISEVDAAQLHRLSKEWIALTPVVECDSIKDSGDHLPRILVVDDHFNAFSDASQERGDGGWRTFYEAVLGRESRTPHDIFGVTPYDQALSLLQNADSSIGAFALAILDVDLGDPNHSGLHLLYQLRALDPFLPIVVVTAFDDAEICQGALELQADAFFVKELFDATDRSSLSYYRSFRRTLDFVHQDNPQGRALHRRFRTMSSSIAERDTAARAHIPRNEEGVLGNLTKFFLMLRLCGRYHLFDRLVTHIPGDLATNTHYEELLVALLDATIAWFNWDVPANVVPYKGLGEWLSEKDHLRGSPEFRFVTRMSNYSGARHGAIKRVSLAIIMQRCSDFLDLVERSLAPSRKRSARNELPGIPLEIATAVLRAQEREVSLLRDHASQSRMGSEAVLLGGYLSTMEKESFTSAISELLEAYELLGPDEPAPEMLHEIQRTCTTEGLYFPPEQSITPQSSILLVDDHGETNGWVYATQLIFNTSELLYLKFEGRNARETFEEYTVRSVGSLLGKVDYILLDLRMPKLQCRNAKTDVSTGVEVAAIIRSIDPLIPIVFLSAHREAIVMRRGLSQGGSACFPKEAPRPHSIESVLAYAQRFHGIPVGIGLDTDGEIGFFRSCRSVYSQLLDNMLRSSGGRGHLLRTICSSVTPSVTLTKYLGLKPTATSNEVAVHVLQRIAWLFSRSVFFAILPGQQYAGIWRRYFAEPVGLRENFISFQGLWLTTAMLSEFVLNVASASIGLVIATPRERPKTENTKLKALLGGNAHDIALSLWDDRNFWRYNQEIMDPSKETQHTRRQVEKVIDLLRNLGLVSRLPQTTGSQVTQADRIVRLQENLDKGRWLALRIRDCLGKKREIAATQRNIETTHNPIYARRMAELSQDLENLANEIRSVSLDDLLLERTALLSTISTATGLSMGNTL